MKFAVRLSDNSEYITADSKQGEQAALKAEQIKAKKKGRCIVLFEPINEKK